jgi:polygalacturonase
MELSAGPGCISPGSRGLERMNPRILLRQLLPLLFLPCVAAQNARPAVEPFFPPLCGTVDAQLKANGNSISPADEQKVDTARIQRAIDRCGKGRAVRLRVNEENNAFLTGPLVLKPEVTLILDRGVTLFASRDASLYDVRMGSCGVPNDVPAACKPLISANKADGAGIMGDGVIDGRGGEKILNRQVSWWEFAGQSGEGGRARVPRLISAEESDHFTVYRITLKNPPSDAVYFDHGDGLTIWGVHVDAPRGSSSQKAFVTGDGAKNISITRSGTGGADQDAH